MGFFDSHLKKSGPKNPDDKKSTRRPLPTKKEVSKLYVPLKNMMIYRVLPSLVTSSGLILPTDALDAADVEYPHMGVVLVAGDELNGNLFKYGVFVYYNQFAARRFTNQATSQECLIIHLNDILVVDPDFKAYSDQCILDAAEVIPVEEDDKNGKAPKKGAIYTGPNGIIS